MLRLTIMNHQHFVIIDSSHFLREAFSQSGNLLDTQYISIPCVENVRKLFYASVEGQRQNEKITTLSSSDTNEPRFQQRNSNMLVIDL